MKLTSEKEEMEINFKGCKIPKEGKGRQVLKSYKKVDK